MKLRSQSSLSDLKLLKHNAEICEKTISTMLIGSSLFVLTFTLCWVLCLWSLPGFHHWYNLLNLAQDSGWKDGNIPEKYNLHRQWQVVAECYLSSQDMEQKHFPARCRSQPDKRPPSAQQFRHSVLVSNCTLYIWNVVIIFYLQSIAMREWEDLSNWFI
jgi:hypothetical protein